MPPASLGIRATRPSIFYWRDKRARRTISGPGRRAGQIAATRALGSCATQASTWRLLDALTLVVVPDGYPSDRSAGADSVEISRVDPARPLTSLEGGEADPRRPAGIGALGASGVERRIGKGQRNKLHGRRADRRERRGNCGRTLPLQHTGRSTNTMPPPIRNRGNWAEAGHHRPQAVDLRAPAGERRDRFMPT